MMIRALALALSVTLVAAAAAQEAPPAHPGPPPSRYRLDHIIAETQRNHATVAAAEAGVEAARNLLTEARRAYWPSFTLEGLIAPSVTIRCSDGGVLSGDPANPVRSSLCLSGDVHNPATSLPEDVLTRWEMKLNMPIYTFGRLAAARDSAEQTLATSVHRLDAARLELAYQAKRAYYGLKVARELLDMANEGREKLSDAIKHVEEGLEKGGGNDSETDRLRLKVAASLVDSHTLEAGKAERLARAGLKVLLPGHTDVIDVDEAPIEEVAVPERPLAAYVELARKHRPEALMLRYGELAARANVAANEAAFFPDITLTGNVYGLLATSENDDPLSPYMLHPFAPWGYGAGLVIRWGLDLHLKIPRYERAKADHRAVAEAARASWDTMTLDIATAYENIDEAHHRIEVLTRGEKAARSWLTAILQNFAVGTAEAREFNDALLAYFEAHGRYLQAIYDYNMAVAWMSRLCGVELVGPPADRPH
jgi:outer membrane protein TolC